MNFECELLLSLFSWMQFVRKFNRTSSFWVVNFIAFESVLHANCIVQSTFNDWYLQSIHWFSCRHGFETAANFAQKFSSMQIYGQLFFSTLLFFVWDDWQVSTVILIEIAADEQNLRFFFYSENSLYRKITLIKQKISLNVWSLEIVTKCQKFQSFSHK